MESPWGNNPNIDELTEIGYLKWRDNYGWLFHSLEKQTARQPDHKELSYEQALAVQARDDARKSSPVNGLHWYCGPRP